MARHAFFPTLLLALTLQFLAVPVQAAKSGETLLPATTKGFLSIPDLDDFRAAFDRTQLGQLVQDPVMKPFVEDLQRQLKSKLNKTSVRLGIRWEDLADTYGGEICFAIIQPRDVRQPHAIAMLVDVTDHQEQAQQLLQKISKNLVAKGATRSTLQIEGLETVRFAVPDKDDDTIIHHAYYRIHDNHLIATDHRQVQQQVYQQLQETGKDNLAQVPAFAKSMKQCQQAAGDSQPHLRWYVDPFGYAQVLRDAARGRKNHKKILGLLANQGFDAVHGLGGWVTFALGEHDITHHTWVHAPADRAGVAAQLAKQQEQSAAGKKLDTRIAAKSTDKYTLASRMLRFPNTAQTGDNQSWVPNDVSSYLTLNWKIKEAFEYSKTLVNEMLDAEPGEDLFEEILTGIAHDVNGPQVDFREDLIKYFGQQIYFIGDHTLPVKPDSERWLFALDINDAKAVKKAIEKLMEAEPNKKVTRFKDQIIWEIINAEEEVDIELDISGAGFGPFGEEEEEEVGNDAAKLLAKWAICVNSNGKLMVASSAKYIVHILKSTPANSLQKSVDLQQVNASLEKMGATNTCLRLFTRTDKAYHTSYELLRQGKMPESKSLFGMMLNRLLSPTDDETVREQQIDGSQMPAFELVAKYLGPSGGFVTTKEDGWFMSGCLLQKTTAP